MPSPRQRCATPDFLFFPSCCETSLSLSQINYRGVNKTSATCAQPLAFRLSMVTASHAADMNGYILVYYV